jgi:hypothetical protein
MAARIITPSRNGQEADPGGSFKKTSMKEDPVYQSLMFHQCPKSTLPLHIYYSEFGLGQGDPLLKAAMKKWPYSTRDSEDEPVEVLLKKPTRRRNREEKKRRNPNHPGDPFFDNIFWFFNDLVHFENHKLVGTKPGPSIILEEDNGGGDEEDDHTKNFDW